MKVDIEKVKQGLRNCDCRKTNCDGCSYRYGGLCSDNITDCTGDLASDALSVIEEQQEEIERLQPRWIPVSERLPKSMVNKVLVWLEHDDLVGYIGYGHYEKYKGVETWYDLEHEEPFSTNGYRVTYWMPLPEPPKDGDSK